MTDVEQSRLLLGFNEWADLRILAAAEKLKPDDYAPLVEQFAHTLGTMRWWHARWTGGEYGRHAIPDTIAAAHEMFGRAHSDLRDFAASLTEEKLEHNQRWKWENEMELPIGELIVQVVNHGTQHRSEIALVLTEHGFSPGDLDYLFFRLPQERFPR